MTKRLNPKLTGKIYAPVPVSTASEEWRDVVGGEGFYLVSSLGRVYSFHRGQFMKLVSSSKIYLKTALSINGKRHEVRIHTLVAAAFIGPCPNGEEPNHKNGVKTDNCWDNLEYGTHSHNVKHAWITGLRAIRGSRRKVA